MATQKFTDLASWKEAVEDRGLVSMTPWTEARPRKDASHAEWTATLTGKKNSPGSEYFGHFTNGIGELSDTAAEALGL